MKRERMPDTDRWSASHPCPHRRPATARPAAHQTTRDEFREVTSGHQCRGGKPTPISRISGSGSNRARRRVVRPIARMFTAWSPTRSRSLRSCIAYVSIATLRSGLGHRLFASRRRLTRPCFLDFHLEGIGCWPSPGNHCPCPLAPTVDQRFQAARPPDSSISPPGQW